MITYTQENQAGSLAEPNLGVSFPDSISGFKYRSRTGSPFEPVQRLFLPSHAKCATDDKSGP